MHAIQVRGIHPVTSRKPNYRPAATILGCSRIPQPRASNDILPIVINSDDYNQKVLKESKFKEHGRITPGTNEIRGQTTFA